MNQQLKKILELAISFEKESYRFYIGLKDTIKNQSLHEMLNELAQAEIGHRVKLENLVEKGENEGEEIFKELEPKEIEDMKLSDFLVPIILDKGSTFQDILISAMHREAKANEFYVNMQSLTQSEETRNLFVFLAVEEMEHKNILEKLYEDEVYTEF